MVAIVFSNLYLKEWKADLGPWLCIDMRLVLYLYKDSQVSVY